MVVPTDELALRVALNASACPPDEVRLMFATDTLHVSEVFVAPWLADEVEAADDLELVERVPLTFADGRMTSPWASTEADRRRAARPASAERRGVARPPRGRSSRAAR